MNLWLAGWIQGPQFLIFAILMPFESQPWLFICQTHLGRSSWCSHVSLVNSLRWASSTDPKLDEVVPVLFVSFISQQPTQDIRRSFSLSPTLCFCIFCEGYGQFFAALKVETGESGGKLALIGSTRDFLICLFMALGGYFAKGFGFVNLAILGSALVVLSLILDGILPSTSWLFLSFSIMSGSGCGLLFVPSCMVLYKELSGRMLPVAVGIGAAGGSVGTMVLNFVLEHLTEAWGWRYARQVLGAALLILLTMNTLALWCCLLGKRQKADQESDSQGESSEGSERSDSLHLKLSGQHAKEFVRPCASPSFALLSIGLILYNIGFAVPYTHLVFFAQLHDYEKGEMLISIMGAASLVGRILCG